MNKKRRLPLAFLIVILSTILFMFLLNRNEEINDTETNSNNWVSSSDIYTEESTSQDLSDEEVDTSWNHSIEEDLEVKNYMDMENTTIYKNGFCYSPITEELKTRINGLSYKENCSVPYEELRYVTVLYNDFNNEIQEGELICNKDIAQDLVEIFYELYQANYPIEQIRLIDEYQADDDLSCLDNNTSCFNFREVAGTTKLSKHAYGLAIDINPFYNPYVTFPNGVEKVSPIESLAYADRSKDFAFKIDKDDLCYQLFTNHGFTWGGNWNSLKDYQHFQKD